MKISLIFIALLFIQFVFAQDKLNSSDSIKEIEKSAFIKDFSNQLNIKIQISNDVQTLYVPINDKAAEISPNLGLKYSLSFNYRFLSISLGIRPSKSKNSIESKGESTISDFKIALLFNRWSQSFFYNKIEGYYIENGDEIFPSTNQDNIYVQLPNFTTKIYSGNTSYKLNDNYSLKSIQSQTQIQLKSAGSFIPNLKYSYYEIEGLDKIIKQNGEITGESNYNDYTGVSILLNLSYNYTFVIKKWFANISLNPGIGVNFYKRTNYNDGVSSEQSFDNFIVSPKGSIGAGYSADKIYFGLEYYRGFTDQNAQNSELPFQLSGRSFFAYFGYRFRAPKAISQPVQYIEKKVPVLDND